MKDQDFVCHGHGVLRLEMLVAQQVCLGFIDFFASGQSG